MLIVKKVLKRVKENIDDLQATNDLLRVKKNHKCSGQIKVGFLVQLPEIWDKQVLVYEAMKNNNKFKVYLFVVPKYDFIAGSVETKYEDNYFLNKYEDAIKTYNRDTWIDLKEYNLDYLFYPRPYDHYLPKQYRSSATRKFVKCCYIPYGYNGGQQFDGMNTDKKFFKNIYCVFADTDYTADLISKKFNSSKEKAAHKIVFLGYPALEPYFDIKNKNVINTVLWSPRWTYDENIGGSHFLEYKDIVLDWAKKYPNIKVVFRPHPLMFEELIKKKKMTEQEVQEFFGELERLGIEYDRGNQIYEVFGKTDVLVTDFSSIIIEYFVTGGPIIYCDGIISFNEGYEIIKDEIYRVKNEDELDNAFIEIINNKLEISESRKDIIEKLKENHKHATDRIVEAIIDDAR